MKTFKQYMAESDDTQFFVRVLRGRAQLCNVKGMGACSTFGTNIVTAMINGDIIITTNTSGVTQIWKVHKGSRSVTGPIRSM